jgi:hypothetical protein
MTPLKVLPLVAAAGVALLFRAAARAETPSIDPPLGRIEIRADLPKEPPFVGEPIILHVRSSLRANATRDKILQPALTDFDWQQFGVDASSEEMLDGFWTPVIERVLMVTPLKAGSLTIPPFTRHVEFVTPNEDRGEANFVSNSLVIDVRSHEGLGSADEPWLPAKSVKISDKWEPAPDKIPFGETAHRVLTIEAKGLTADRLPAPPILRAPGIISFLGPVDRQTIVTDDGPVGRVAYSWNVRPVSITPATAPAIHIPWFDVATRKMREVVAPEREVAFVDAARKTRETSAPIETFHLLSVWPLTAFFMSFAWTSAVAYLIATRRSHRGG